jgi:hypothetical protein
MASQDIVCYFCCYVCESDLGHSLFTTRQRDGQSPSKMAVCSVEKNVGGQRHHASMVCHLRVWIRIPTFQLVLRGNAAVQFFDQIKQLYNEKGLTWWHNHISLNRSCRTVNSLVVDLRERHWEYWTPYSETNPREHNSKRSTYHQWCPLPIKRALVTYSPYILAKYMFLNLPRDVIRSTARFRLRVHTLRFETATWD